VLLLAQAAQPHGRDIAYVLFWIGAAGQLALAMAIAGRWIGGAFTLGEVTPGWFLPTFGGLLASVAGAALGETEVAWLFFGFAVIVGMPIMALVLYRLCFHAPLPPPLAPTLVIMVAPIALAFLAWQALSGGPDAFGRVLLYGAVSIALIVATRVRRLAATPFGLSWWAVSFPLDALSGAILVYGRVAGSPDLELTGIVLAALTSLVILYLFGRTLVFLHNQRAR
jgi:tellurite resistance protein